MDFVKMHGLGNDFVVVDAMTDDVSLTADQVRFLCDRHMGIGTDGVIIVRPGLTAETDGFMDYINADGSLAQMCGNGVRVTAKFLVDGGYVDGQVGEMNIDTRAGVRHISFACENGLLQTATVSMGEPVLNPAEIPVDADSENIEVDTPWGTIGLTCVSMGNPHAICFIDDQFPAELLGSEGLATLDIDRIGAYLESHPIFPEKANIEFVEIRDGKALTRVFERGVGETLACGTGACAVLVAAHRAGHMGRDGIVALPGGELHIAWTDDNTIDMTGPATTVYHGQIGI